MRYHFCIDKKDIDLVEISKHFEKKLGVKLHADREDDEVNGALFACHYDAGEKHGKCWCGFDLSEIPGEHTCIMVETYDVNEPPSPSHRTRFRKPPQAKIKGLHKEFNAFLKKKKLKGRKVMGSRTMGDIIIRAVDK